MSEEDVYTVDCPECHQPAGQRCVYLPLADVDPDFIHYRSPAVQRRFALTGTPTRRPHNGRRNALTVVRARRAYRERLKQMQAEVVPASPARRAIAVAEVEFDRREWLALRSWLATNGGILINADRETP